MIDNHFRSILPLFTGPIIRAYQRAGLTPNQITLIGLPIASLAAVCVALEWNIFGVAIWWLGRLFDGTDGIYARETGTATPFGAYLDIVCDMAAYSLMVLGFYWAYQQFAMAWIIVLFLYVLCIASALALGGIQREHQLEGSSDNRGLQLGAGLAEGGETGIAYTVFLLFPQHLALLVWVWIAVLVTTVIARTLLAYDLFKHRSIPLV